MKEKQDASHGPAAQMLEVQWVKCILYKTQSCRNLFADWDATKIPQVSLNTLKPKKRAVPWTPQHAGSRALPPLFWFVFSRCFARRNTRQNWNGCVWNWNVWVQISKLLTSSKGLQNMSRQDRQEGRLGVERLSWVSKLAYQMWQLVPQNNWTAYSESFATSSFACLFWRRKKDWFRKRRFSASRFCSDKPGCFSWSWCGSKKHWRDWRQVRSGAKDAKGAVFFFCLVNPCRRHLQSPHCFHSDEDRTRSEHGTCPFWRKSWKYDPFCISLDGCDLPGLRGEIHGVFSEGLGSNRACVPTSYCPTGCRWWLCLPGPGGWWRVEMWHLYMASCHLGMEQNRWNGHEEGFLNAILTWAIRFPAAGCRKSLQWRCQGALSLFLCTPNWVVGNHQVGPILSQSWLLIGLVYDSADHQPACTQAKPSKQDNMDMS